MKKNAAAVFVAGLCLASVVVSAGPKPEDFKVRLTAVAVADAEKEELKTKKFPPETHIVVTPGNIAVFDLEYDFPTNVKSRLFLGPNFEKSQLDENPFGTSGSGLYSGKGKTSRVILLGAGGNEPYDQSLLLRSVRVEGEIEAEKGARRNNSFFICDAPVNVLFANKGEESGKGAKTLEPSPSPEPDPALGVVSSDEAQADAPKSSTPRGFTDNLDAALAKAKAEGKLVFACFSGSDWCGWCMKLEREVLSRPEFLAGVKNDFVLVFIDMPENKGVLSDHAKTANPKLVKKYGIKGFPTALILDGDGKKVGETGYRKGGPVEYAKHLMSMRRGIKYDILLP